MINKRVSWETLFESFPIGTKPTLIGVLSLLFVYLVTFSSLVTCARRPSCGTKTFQTSVWGVVEGDLLYCEYDEEEGFIKERRNSLSSLCYLFFGFLVFFFGCCDWYFWRRIHEDSKEVFLSTLICFPGLSILYGIALCFVGFGSFIYHAYPTKISVQSDRVGIIIVLLAGTVLTVVTKNRYLPLENESTRRREIYGALFLALLVGVPSVTITYRTVFVTTSSAYTGIIVGIAAVLVLSTGKIIYDRQHSDLPMRKISLWLLGISLSLFLIGGLTQEEYVPVKCYPKSFLQKHAFWHFSTSIGFLLYYISVRLDGSVVLIETSLELVPNMKEIL